MSEASVLSSHGIEKKSNDLNFSVTRSLTSDDHSAIRLVIVCLDKLTLLKSSILSGLTLPTTSIRHSNELTIRERFTMFSNKTSYFVTRESSIFGNIFSAMKTILLRRQTKPLSRDSRNSHPTGKNGPLNSSTWEVLCSVLEMQNRPASWATC